MKVCCDVLIAVYNYWEPLHLLAMHKSTDEDTAFETWEYAPQYAIRSWAYIALHAVIPRVVSYLPGPTVRLRFLTLVPWILCFACNASSYFSCM